MKPWTFIHVSDMQPGSPKSFRYDPALTANWNIAREQIRRLQPDLLLVGGDLTRDGSIHRFELEEMKTELSDLPCPYHVIPGNMDTGNKHTRKEGLHRRSASQSADTELNVTSRQLQQFSDVFGPLWWSVDHKNVRFSGFADMLINSGLPEEDAFWNWAQAQAERSKAQHHVWIMHYPLFIERPDEPNWEIDDPENYMNWYFSIDTPGRGRLLELFKATGTDIVISGHVHCHRAAVSDGIRFEIAPSCAFGQWPDRWPDGNAALGFLKYTVADEGIECEFVPLEQTADRSGQKYGLGGHPAPHARDYSLALDPSYAREHGEHGLN